MNHKSINITLKHIGHIYQVQQLQEQSYQPQIWRNWYQQQSSRPHSRRDLITTTTTITLSKKEFSATTINRIDYNHNYYHSRQGGIFCNHNQLLDYNHNYYRPQTKRNSLQLYSIKLIVTTITIDSIHRGTHCNYSLINLMNEEIDCNLNYYTTPNKEKVIANTIIQLLQKDSCINCDQTYKGIYHYEESSCISRHMK